MFVLAVIAGGFLIGLGFVFVVDGFDWLWKRGQQRPVAAEGNRRSPAEGAVHDPDSTIPSPAAQAVSKSKAEAKPTGSRPSSKPASKAGSVREEVVKKPTVPEKKKRENHADGTLAEEESASSTTESENTDDDKSSTASGRDELVVINHDKAVNGEAVDAEEDTLDDGFAPPTKPRKNLLRKDDAGHHDISIHSAADTASTISAAGSEPASSESSYNLRPRRRPRREI